MSAIFLIIAVAIIGGGIYLWIQWHKKQAKKRHDQLVAQADLLDQSGNLTSEALDRLVSTRSSHPDSDSDNAAESGGETDANGNENSTPDAVAPSGAPSSAPTDATADNGAARSPITAVPARRESPRQQEKINRIREAAERFLNAWRVSSESVRGWEHANNRVQVARYSIQSAAELYRLKSESDFGDYFARLHGEHVSRNEHIRNIVRHSAVAPESTRETRVSWEALVSLLAAFDEAEVAEMLAAGEIGRESACVVLAAHHLRSTSKSSVEALVRELDELTSGGEVKSIAPVTAPDPQGEELQKLRSAVERVQRAGLDTASAYFACKNALSEQASAFYRLDELGEKTIVRPRKPTPEEVMRYLSDIEDLSAETLEAEREAHAERIRAKSSLDTLRSSLEALRQTIAQQRTLLDATGNDLYTAVIEAASVYGDQLEKWTQSESGKVQDAQKRSLRSGEAMTTASPEETEQIKTLRAVKRTLGFAVAQVVVARDKTQALRHGREDAPSKPRVDRDENFDRALKRFDDYLKKSLDHQTRVDRLSAQMEVVETALAARQAKVDDTVKTLKAAAAPVVAQIKKKLEASAKSQQPANVSDELQVVLGAALWSIEKS